MSVPDDGLFHKHVIRTTLAIFVPIFILLWAKNKNRNEDI